MAVVIETTLGDITVDLYLEQRPVTCLNFLKLCKMKYYNFNLFHTIRSGFIAQTGDPTGEGNGGESIWGILEGSEKRFFSGEKMPKIRHTDAGLLSMVCTGDMMVGSQFFFTLAPDLNSLDGIHCVIGEVTEGQDILRKLNDVICDETYRPYQDVRITHTVVLEDPFNDPPGLRAPSRSPSPSAERLKGGRIAPDEELDETKGKSTAEIQEMIEEKEAKARATILEIVGDLPDADIAPPENVLFVCKLNPVTTDDDLEIIFSRFGKIVSCEVIRDKKTGDSLQYAFIEFADKKSCENAYFKMDNVLIDDRRIHVDFSQSVSKIKWLGKGRGVKHISDDDINIENKRSESKDKNRDNKEREKYSLKQRKQDDRDREKYSSSGSSRRNDDRNRDKYHDQKYHKERESTNHKGREKNRSRSKERIREKRHSPKDEYDSDENNHFYKKNNRLREEIEESSQYNKLNKYGDYKNHRENAHKSTSETRSRNSSQKIQLERYDTNRDNRNNDRSSSKNYIADDRESSKQSKNKQSNKSESQIEKKQRRKDHEEPKTPSPILAKNKDKKNRSKKVTESKKKKIIKRKRKSTSSSDSDTSDTSSSSSDSSSSSERQNNKSKRKKRKYSSTSSSDTSNSSISSSSTSDSSSSTSSSSDSDDKRKRHKKSEKRNNLKKDKRN